MPLLHLFRKWFPKSAPRTAIIADLGEATNDRYGNWTFVNDVSFHLQKVTLSFKTGTIPPSDRDISFFRQVEVRWPELWSKVLEELKRDHEIDGPDVDWASFRSSAKPVDISFGDQTPGRENWEVALEPEFAGHSVTMHMRGFECAGFSLDG